MGFFFVAPGCVQTRSCFVWNWQDCRNRMRPGQLWFGGGSVSDGIIVRPARLTDWLQMIMMIELRMMMTMLNGFQLLPVLCVSLSLSLRFSLVPVLHTPFAGFDFVWVRFVVVLSFELKIGVLRPKNQRRGRFRFFLRLCVCVCVCVPPQCVFR